MTQGQVSLFFLLNFDLMPFYWEILCYFALSYEEVLHRSPSFLSLCMGFCGGMPKEYMALQTTEVAEEQRRELPF